MPSISISPSSSSSITTSSGALSSSIKTVFSLKKKAEKLEKSAIFTNLVSAILFHISSNFHYCTKFVYLIQICVISSNNQKMIG